MTGGWRSRSWSWACGLCPAPPRRRRPRAAASPTPASRSRATSPPRSRARSCSCRSTSPPAPPRSASGTAGTIRAEPATTVRTWASTTPERTLRGPGADRSSAAGAARAIADVTITPQGFSTEAQYDADRKAYCRAVSCARSSRGRCRRGPGRPRKLANIDPTDLDGGVDYRVEVRYYNDPSFDDEPYTRPAHDQPGPTGAAWYRATSTSTQSTRATHRPASPTS